MDYARGYTSAVRYGREPLTETVQQLLAQIDMDPAHREPGSTLRLVLADALDENGRHEEAAHARSKYPMSVRDGRTQLSTLKLHRLLKQMDIWHSDRSRNLNGPGPVRDEAAAELEKVGRTHEAKILRSAANVAFHTAYPTATTSHTVTGNRNAFAWPGGYEIHYYTQDGGILCHNCANGENGSEALFNEAGHPNADPQWTITDHDLHQEGPPLNCDHCGRAIVSDYGDPDNENYEPEDDE